MINPKTINRFCGVKLGFAVSEKRHTDYHPIVSGEIIPLPKLIRVPRHAHDLTKKELRHIGAVLNLNLDELQHGTACHISATTIYLSLCVYLLFTTNQKQNQSSGGWTEFSDPMLKSIKLLLKHVDTLNDTCGHTKVDRVKLGKLRSQFEDISNTSYVDIAKTARHGMEYLDNIISGLPE